MSDHRTVSPNPSSWRARIGSALSSRPAGVFGAVVLLAIFLGCMNLSFGGRSYVSNVEDGVSVQEGEVRLPAGAMQEVYYPVPFASTPNLELCCHFNECVLLEQHPDHFRIQNNDVHFSRTVEWKARGVKGTPCSAPPPVVPVPPPAPPTGPPTPVSPAP